MLTVWIYISLVRRWRKKGDVAPFLELTTKSYPLLSFSISMYSPTSSFAVSQLSILAKPAKLPHLHSPRVSSSHYPRQQNTLMAFSVRYSMYCATNPFFFVEKIPFPEDRKWCRTSTPSIGLSYCAAEPDWVCIQ